MKRGRAALVIKVIDKGGKLGSCGTPSPRVAVVEQAGYPRYLVLDDIKVDKFTLLALANREVDKEQAWRLMNIASHLFHAENDWVFNTLYSAVAMNLTRYL